MSVLNSEAERLEPARHAAERWAKVVLRLSRSRRDPRTLGDWAAMVNISASTIRTWCYLAGVTPRHSLAIARVLRAVALAQEFGCSPQDLLDIRDPRTLKRLLSKAGLAESIDRCTLLDVCEYQTFVKTVGPIEELKRLVLITYPRGGTT